MSNIITVKTGTSAPTSGVLAIGELGFNTVARKVYIGTGPGVPIELGPGSPPDDYIGATSETIGVHGLVPAAETSEYLNFLRGDGTWSQVNLPSDYVGATAGAAGVHGLVPAAASSQSANFLRGDGTWATVVTDGLSLSGGTLTGQLLINVTGDVSPTSTTHGLQIGLSNTTNLAIDQNEIMARSNGVVSSLYLNNEGGNVFIGSGGLSVSGAVGVTNTTDATSTTTGALIISGGVGVAKTLRALDVYGANWNDYAEFRQGIGDQFLVAGTCVCENGLDQLEKSKRRLQAGAFIISDTFGFAIGETDIARTPVAVSGRVLAHTYRDRNKFKVGQPVCAAPDGTVDKMTRLEAILFPDRIIGTVSCIPTYETWGEKNVAVNDRIWIYIK